MLKPFLNKDLVEAGCDEAGRGCLAGPVVAAAVILPKTFSHPHLNDSKLLSEARRNELAPIIKESAISWGIAMVNNEQIDKINILKASIAGMHLAIDKLSQIPELLLIDGNRFYSYKNIQHECIIKGDGKYMSIAAASILAKTFRDEYMAALHNNYPEYDWESNKGYPTKKHRAAIREHGPTKYHRMSFRLLPEQLKLFT